ncbi:Long-chain-fatty-acid--AMP ligase FadD29 [Planctomycetes bacterium CA13]|uniref:Long-chain-fatty-acid--AMP ligase FadD29 n=1 Tax=Novipirellula herctigrandis TaxID=2527986 RepID=A0A5C5ZC16_9BACT|nr:Long-chain-fatty-acid--AMP ligase FadD29 [Planctomycetes bacterium CA13]
MNTLTSLLRHWACQTPEALLYTYRDTHGNITESYDCESFNARVNFVAQQLADRDIVHQGEPVLLIYPSGLEGIIAFMACVKNGAIPAPAPWPDRMSGRAAAERIQHMQADCDARVVLTVSDGLQRLNGSAPTSSRPMEWIATDKWKGSQDHFQTSQCDTLFIQYTSGSTDLPRGVMVTHENIIHNSNVLPDINDGRCCGVSWLPFHHDMGLIGFYLFAIVRGGVTHLMSPADFLKRPQLWFETITTEAATITCAPNFGYQYCLRDKKISDRDLNEFNLSSIRLMMNGAEPVDPVTMDAFADRFSQCGLEQNALVAIYGLAEHTLAVTSGGRRVFDSAECHLPATQGHDHRPTQRPIMSCGFPLPGVELHIVDPNKRAKMPDGGVGEIWLRGESVTNGYWGRNHQEAHSLFTAAFESEGNGNTYLSTGDLGFLLDGELYITGRLKEVILVRGRNIYPIDVESITQRTLNRTGRSLVAAFGSTTHGVSEEIVILIEDCGNPIDLRRVAQAVGEHMGVRPGVTALIPRGKLTTTTSGKIARSACRRDWDSGLIEPIRQYRSRQSSAGDGDISSILQQIEGLPDDESVEYAGLDSLTLTQLQLELLRGAERTGLDVEEFQYDMRIINKLSVGELRLLLPRLKDSSFGSDEIQFLRDVARERIGVIAANEQEQMLADGELALDIQPAQAAPQNYDTADILLTGATGFFGAFLLNSLLLSTDRRIVALVRSTDAQAGRERIIEALQKANVPFGRSGNGFDLARLVEQRVKVVCGDLTEQRLGLSQTDWSDLAQTVGTVYHCGAEVDYIRSYDSLSAANVSGCEEIIRFCASEKLKRLHLISTTFVAGWTSTKVLGESECDPPEGALNFGYAQSKWVAERLAYQALRRGLPVKVFRPSLLTAATTGSFVERDIVSRVFSYLIRYGLRPNCGNQLSFIPADIAAKNIVAVSLCDEATDDTFHVTANNYYNMSQICECISRCYGYEMRECSLDGLIEHVNENCTREDPLYPLVPFINRNFKKLAEMEEKRYATAKFQNALQLAPGSCPEPPLEYTVQLIIDYLKKTGMV